MSIPFVSDGDTVRPYHEEMAKSESKGTKAPAWAIKVKGHMRRTGQRIAIVAPKLGIADSTLRSWLNGNRGPSVPEFIELLKVTKADFAEIANGHKPTEEQSQEAKVLHAFRFGNAWTRRVLLAAANREDDIPDERQKSHK